MWYSNQADLVSIISYPGVAKFGIALEWGSRGLEFESRHSDHWGSPVTVVVTGLFHMPRFFYPLFCPYFSFFGLIALPGHRAKQTVHSLGAGLAHLVSEVAVDVQREGGCGVAQVALHRLNIVAHGDCRHRVGVAQIMEAEVRQTDLGGDFLELVIDGVGGQVLAPLIAEDEVVVLPRRTHLEPLDILLDLMAVKQLHDRGSDTDGPTPAVLGADQLKGRRMTDHLLELLVDIERAVLEVHTVPCQSTDLTAPQSCEQCHHIDILIDVALNGAEERFHLILIQRHDLALFHAGQLAHLGGIAADVADLNGLLQRLVQNAVDAADGLGRETGLVTLRFSQVVIECLNHRS